MPARRTDADRLTLDNWPSCRADDSPLASGLADVRAPARLVTRVCAMTFAVVARLGDAGVFVAHRAIVR